MLVQLKKLILLPFSLLGKMDSYFLMVSPPLALSLSSVPPPKAFKMAGTENFCVYCLVRRIAPSGPDT
jgi:hypothetical protein